MFASGVCGVVNEVGEMLGDECFPPSVNTVLCGAYNTVVVREVSVGVVVRELLVDDISPVVVRELLVDVIRPDVDD